MHAKKIIAVIKHFHRYCVVQVLGIFTIDCDNDSAPEVTPFLNILFLYLLRYLFSLSFYFFGEFLRQIVSSDNRNYVSSYVILMTQYFNYNPFRVSSGFRPLSYFNNYFMSVLCSVEIRLRDKNILVYSRIVRYDKAKPFTVFKGSTKFFALFYFC
jgi:ABC-type multidrug transport system fused ATPase/permease subunit